MKRFFKQFILTTMLALFASQASALFVTADTFDPRMQGVGTNRYAYAGSDPVNNSDRNGHLFKEIFAVAGGAWDGFWGCGCLGGTKDTSYPTGHAGWAVGSSWDAAIGLGNPSTPNEENEEENNQISQGIDGALGNIVNDDDDDDDQNSSQSNDEGSIVQSAGGGCGPDDDCGDEFDSNRVDQNAQDANRVRSNREADRIARRAGYRDAHELKNEFRLDSRSDLYYNSRTGDLYAGPARGQGPLEHLMGGL